MGTSASAEGAGRSANIEFVAGLNRTRATAHGLEYLLLLSRDLEFPKEKAHDSLAQELTEARRMISGR